MTEFESNIKNIYGKEGIKWLAKLPDLVSDTILRLNLYGMKPVLGLTYNYVLSGFQNDIPVILKFSIDSENLKKEAFCLKCFSQLGAVNIMVESDNFLLLQRAIPGNSLEDYFPIKEQKSIDIVCNIISRIQQSKIPKNHIFPHVKELLSTLNKNWDINYPYLQKARSLNEQLLASCFPDTLLHGDLHHKNILRNGSAWIVIDPKGIIGETAYEIAAFIFNPAPELLKQKNVHTIIKNRVNRFSEKLQLPEDHIVKWCFVRAIVSWSWALEDNCDTNYWENITKIFDQMI